MNISERIKKAKLVKNVMILEFVFSETAESEVVHIAKIHLVDLEPEQTLPSDILDPLLYKVVLHGARKPVVPTVVAKALHRGLLIYSNLVVKLLHNLHAIA
jgi:hypothetical protein